MNISKRTSTIFHLILLLVLLYLFFLSIQLMSHSLKLFGKDFAADLIATTSNPIVGLFIGILTTSLIQSSSTTTSILVTLVASGAMTIENAIPIVMGANIGTTITNILVSMAHITRGQEFKRAFAASVVHDMFNIIAVAIILPIHLFTNFLYDSATFLGKIFENIGGLKFASPIKVITSPVIELLSKITFENGIVTLILSLVFLFIALKYLVSTIKVLVIAKVEAVFDKVIFKNAAIAMFFGFLLTAVVQSSSITTSLIVPLAGAGILTVYQIFPYTLGTNVGTTVTALMAALATNNVSAVIVACAHFLFNISGIIIIWPIRKIPIFLAIKFAEIGTERKVLAVTYVIAAYFLIPILLIYIF
ncbi:Na/Pi symporter [candidate division KSB1 bacterium]